AKRRLRLAIAGAQSPADAAREIRKRLTAISRSRSFVDWQNRRALVDDLEAQPRAIVEHVGKSDPKEALDLMWRFMALASSVFARCDYSSGDYLKRLPDFDDIEAESRGLDFAEKFEHFSAALSFLAAWPAPDRAAKLVLTRADKLDGDRYEVLTPVADALAGKHPLAATLALRAMIEFSLDNGRSSRYKHAARHFQECAGLASAIADFGQFEPHEPFAARIRGKHGKKTSFWNLVP
ncbi:DUF6880 family protein, partial [Methylocystis sp.]|uniref:DUF6880 family protein n=1 Tax=Methylocystis sp. TaxID=1911079 RepID=UPI00345B90F9